ncbi:flagellar filament capping protein FliD [Sulfurimonas microaerophilic]|uniref:flagellar filament capping protein FliD n=1 Tax=Sulfurimonas microaerophilic TaxID=3058392 RepID=UPI0027154DFC|nr:flagellar filament capping protein FliD [Sulfurimonas sp. hsl 1-7]
MAISSLGLGSGVLTMDVLDQLKAADEAARINPLERQLLTIQDKQAEFNVLDATMTNLFDSIWELKSPTLYDGRSTSVSGTSVEVTASANSDIQSFTLNVLSLATTQIEQSGSFTSATTAGLVATAAGSMNLNVNGTDYTINYDQTMTLDDIKAEINNVAGADVNATVVQVASGDFRLFLNSVNTGTTQDITITDTTGNLAGTQLTTGMTAVQTGSDAQFEFNGQLVTRTSNNVTDLITGYDITLKEVGSSTVDVTQNRDEIMMRIDSFVEKYNSAMTYLNKVTKNSIESDERGLFSSDSTIRNMQNAIRNAMDTIGGGVSNLYEYGFDIDKDGKLTVDKTVLNDKLDTNAGNVEVFFSGGNYDNGDGTTTAIDGAFTELYNVVETYTGLGKSLDNLKTSISDSISSLEERKATAIERLNNKYDTMAQQWGAYDSLIARFTSSANAFIMMVNAQSASSSN